MVRNKGHFQKGPSEAGFETIYGTEQKCRAVVIASWFPTGCSSWPTFMPEQVRTRQQKWAEQSG